MADVKTVPSPCETCSRVKDPKDCDNKSCGRWCRWWLARWKEIGAVANIAESKEVK